MVATIKTKYLGNSNIIYPKCAVRSYCSQDIPLRQRSQAHDSCPLPPTYWCLNLWADLHSTVSAPFTHDFSTYITVTKSATVQGNSSKKSICLILYLQSYASRSTPTFSRPKMKDSSDCELRREEIGQVIWGSLHIQSCSKILDTNATAAEAASEANGLIL